MRTKEEMDGYMIFFNLYRYGEFHPAFFVGPLKDAIEEAAGSSAPEVQTNVLQ